MTPSDSTASRRGERILAYMFTAMVAVAVLAIVLLICSAFFGNSGNFDQGLWPAIALTPLLALPIAFILALTLFIVVARRRSRDAAAAASGTTGTNRLGAASGTADRKAADRGTAGRKAADRGTADLKAADRSTAGRQATGRPSRTK